MRLGNGVVYFALARRRGGGKGHQRGAGGGRGGRHVDMAAALEDGEAPATFAALLADVLFAYAAPEDVVVGEGLPAAADLGCAAEGHGVEASEHFEGDLAGKDGEG